ncbi:hypothetical protein DMN91_011793 [Ooceraea biroi]|uniref:Eukaryotic translation elongation factor 1 epsilon-1 n=1 Tax=Ooceraea biroi TaxID=2015173 RepID=A0A026WQF2_OOCBI|nr:eukaryotic translation elongation factor 1 epsilon-1 [Ooceraea biroi]EZA58158.1 Eukaryotic translation elongation factor 1 epsilon-1 [Ooceraea biroi]RLU16035.1 hypothetical protein DMN91_011793 [Ooceraea biroi]
MGLCNTECVERIAQYLDVSPGRLEVSHKNVASTREREGGAQPVQGFCTIVQDLARTSEYPDILGSEREVQALTQQWLEYAIVCANYADLSQNTKRILSELNTSLTHVPYIAGTEKTIADVTLYYVLHPVMKTLSQPEKARYIHVSRWFDNIQQEDKLRRELDLISFNLLHLFL